VLTRLGYRDEEIRALASDGVIGIDSAPPSSKPGHENEPKPD
jgi:hypothetical protein